MRGAINMILTRKTITETDGSLALKPKKICVNNCRRDEPQEVYPFKNVEDIAKIKNYFLNKKQYRNYTLFVLGINTGLRCGDILNLEWNDVLDNTGCVLDKIVVREEKTEKFRPIYFNASVKEALTLLQKKEKRTPTPAGYIFKSQRNDHLEVNSVYRMLKDTAKEVGITFNVGTHSMRKTWGYHQYISHVDSNPKFILELQKMFNHSSSEITLAYIGITDECNEQYYNDINL
jgi:integrase